MNLEERVELLEKRIEILEAMAASPRVEKTQSGFSPTVQNIQVPPEMNSMKPAPQVVRPKQIEKKPVTKKFNEALFGKYIVGALASFLVFIAAISLVALVWDRMSSGGKLALLAAAGLLLTEIGLLRIKKHRNPISAIILGTGSGLLFISILAANMAFELISSRTAFLLAGIWALAFIFLYRYTKMFFTTVIAYTGSFIAVMLGLSLIKNQMDFIVVASFVACIGLAMIITGRMWLDESKQLAGALLTYVNATVIFLYGCFDNQMLLTHWVYYFFVLMLLMYILANRTFYLLNKLKSKVIYIILSFTMSVLTLLGMGSLYEPMGNAAAIAIAAAIFLAQMVFDEWRNNVFSKQLTVLYSGFLCFTVMMFNMEMFEIPVGISLVALGLLARDAITKRESLKRLEGVIVLFDALCVTAYTSGNSGQHIIAYILLAMLQLFAISVVLIKHYRRQDQAWIVASKGIGVISSSMVIFFVLGNAFNYINRDGLFDSGYTIGFLALTIHLIILIGSGYFYDWTSMEFQWFGKNSRAGQDGSSKIFYIISTTTYFLGLIFLYTVRTQWEQWVISLCLLAISLIQTHNLLKLKKYKPIVGIWIGFKYWILTWSILNTAFNLEMDSVFYSVMGLVLALLCIAVGFKHMLKSLRLYGLILTILMVLKFIVVDLSRENSITRVLALMSGGLICFGISILYNKLNLIIRRKDGE